MAVYIKNSNTWKNTKQYVKVSGTWKQVLNIYVKQSNIWKPLYSYSYVTGNWGTCSVTCGGGTQTRTAVCTRNDGLTFTDSICTSAGITKPSTSSTCNTQSCTTYSWYTGSYGSCNTSCGTGTKTRTVYCKNSNGIQVADSYCSGTKPSTSSSCTTCTGCSISESAIVSNKVKQLNAIVYQGRTNWTSSEVRPGLVAANGSVTAWWNQWGTSESICPWSNTTCCVQSGYSYY